MTTKKPKEAAPNTSEALPGGVTPEQIDAWKAKYGEGQVFQIQVPRDDEGKNFATAIVRKPDLAVMAKASPLDGDPIGQGLVIFNECFLAGDPEIMHHEEVKTSVIHAINSLFKVRRAVVKNL